MGEPRSTAPDPPGHRAWRVAVDKVLGGADFDATLVGRTADGLRIEPLYPKAEHPAPCGPRTHAPSRLLQRADHPDPQAANALARADLDGGADGLVLTVEGASTARGFGLPVDGLDRVLAGIGLERTALRLETPPFAGGPAHLELLRLIDRQQLDPATLDIDFGLDPLGDMARTGLSPPADSLPPSTPRGGLRPQGDGWGAPSSEPSGEPHPSLRATFPGAGKEGSGAGRESWAAQAMEGVNALRDQGFASPMLRADGRAHHEGGASEAQELAAVLASAIAYLRALEAGGHPLDAARRLISFTLAADTDEFLGIAKLRALRRLWATVEAACGLEPRPLRLHVETAWRVLTRRDPSSNMLRATLGCTAAALGGADSITVLPYTAAAGLPDRFAHRLARNTHLILFAESNLGRVADPAAGAGGFEALTEALCQAAWGLLQQIEAAGGMAMALTSGLWQSRLAETRERRQAAVAAGHSPIVGTSSFRNPTDIAPAVLMQAPPAPTGSTAHAFEPLLTCRDAEPFERDDTA